MASTRPAKRRWWWRFTYKDLSVDEWYGIWATRFEMWWCGKRGHKWNAWTHEYYEGGCYGPGYRNCSRCSAFEREEDE